MGYRSDWFVGLAKGQDVNIETEYGEITITNRMVLMYQDMKWYHWYIDMEYESKKHPEHVFVVERHTEDHVITRTFFQNGRAYTDFPAWRTFDSDKLKSMGEGGWMDGETKYQEMCENVGCKVD